MNGPVIAVFDSNRDRAKAFARELTIRMSQSRGIVIISTNGEEWQTLQLAEVSEDETLGIFHFTKADLYLVHGNDCKKFDVSFPSPNEPVIWYGGYSGYWFEYPALKTRDKECEKIFTAIPGARIPLSNQELLEIIAYAENPTANRKPTCLQSPPDTGLISVLSIAIQCELSCGRSKLLRLARSSSSGASLTKFLDLLSEVDSTPVQAPDWPSVIAILGNRGQNCIGEAQVVARAQGFPDTWTSNFEGLLSSICSDIEAGRPPSTEALCNLYTSLCELEKGAAEE
jgi:hypothetical protein